MLALRVNRIAGGPSTTGLALDYRGPVEWRAEAESGPPPAPHRLVDDADALLARVPFGPARAPFLVAQTRSLRTVARRLAGEVLPLAEYTRRCLGIDPEWVPETVFEEAHALLDHALPRAAVPLARRLADWQRAHTLGEPARLPELVGRAVAETRARTDAIVPLPDDEIVDCQPVPNAPFLAAGRYAGGLRSTIFVNADTPFNLADLLYVVAHEGHPGHIAEALLKEIHLGDRPELGVSFLLSPPFVLSEGFGLHAQRLVFPDDEAQRWLTDHVLAEQGIRPDGSDFAAVHHAKNLLWGVWANATHLAAEGRPAADVAAYLTRWALLDDTDVDRAMAVVNTPGGNPYVFTYYHGWRLLDGWLDGRGRVRRFLTTRLLPADLR
ncbi:hypothetical protein [Saccharothrix obliqua]|uniref:hypothetical protein n=1 Tax=Saccharothrix obliqua TaxID=2861747 RepID=UPI001C5CE88F|nr:hypothetical protein [Saccharothrix obliqua]MBW4718360.1 hypothetical protein [Saccharothrix obliqua]